MFVPCCCALLLNMYLACYMHSFYYKDSMAIRSSIPLKAGKQDRLSALPDSILCHILSCLHTKHAVATSVLSTRWKYLYRSVPVIDLGDNLYPKTETRGGTGTEMAYNGFIRFCNRVLLLRNGVDIVKFRLNYRRDYDGSLIYDWICAALCRNVQELDLCAESHGDSRKQHVPTEIFTHKRLLTLKLLVFAISVPHSVCLPNLRTLDLRHVTFPGGVGDLLKLLAGCKSIQDFTLEGMIQYYENANCNLFTPSLRRLTLIYTDLLPVIDCPKLEYLSIISEDVYAFELKNLASLVRASIHLENWAWLSDIVDGLSSLKFLSLGGTCGKSSLGGFSLLSKLQYLEVVELCPGLECDELCSGFECDCGCDLGVVPQLLNNTPYLQTLILDLSKISTKVLRRNEFSLLDAKKPLCLDQKLRKVEIKDFSGTEAEFKMIEYLLQHGEVLESVNFKYSGRDPAEVWTDSKWRRLLMFPRCSKFCKVVQFQREILLDE